MAGKFEKNSVSKVADKLDYNEIKETADEAAEKRDGLLKKESALKRDRDEIKDRIDTIMESSLSEEDKAGVIAQLNDALNEVTDLISETQEQIAEEEAIIQDQIAKSEEAESEYKKIADDLDSTELEASDKGLEGAEEKTKAKIEDFNALTKSLQDELHKPIGWDHGMHRFKSN